MTAIMAPSAEAAIGCPACICTGKWNNRSACGQTTNSSTINASIGFITSPGRLRDGASEPGTDGAIAQPSRAGDEADAGEQREHAEEEQRVRERRQALPETDVGRLVLFPAHRAIVAENARDGVKTAVPAQDPPASPAAPASSTPAPPRPAPPAARTPKSADRAR